MKDDIKLITTNRQAYHDYHIEDTFEAGLVLTGTEIKSIRFGRVNLRESYARIDKGEAWLINCHIAPYEAGYLFNQPPKRDRKLLLHKTEIARLASKTEEKGLTLVPLKLYLKDDKAKVELGLARGKKLYDKRAAIAERDAKRELERVVKYK